MYILSTEKRTESLKKLICNKCRLTATQCRLKFKYNLFFSCDMAALRHIYY